MYELIARPLFWLPAEFSHGITLGVLEQLHRLGMARLLAAPVSAPAQPATVMGLEFPHRIGLAAGLDKNGDHIDALAALGFAFLEIGTLTPRRQAGNPKPRLFRDRRGRCIVNRMGFNNKGIKHAVARARGRRSKVILGVNIGRNRDTPAESAAADYLRCLRECHEVADYVAVNISSPNTPGLRELQFGAGLERLLEALKQAQSSLQTETGKYLPLALKLAPDLTQEEIRSICANAAELARRLHNRHQYHDHPSGLAAGLHRERKRRAQRRAIDRPFTNGSSRHQVGSGGFHTDYRSWRNHERAGWCEYAGRPAPTCCRFTAASFFAARV